MAAAPLASPPVPGPLLPSADGTGRVPILAEFAAPVKQNRLTVAFRLVLAIPHSVVLYFVGIAAGVILVIGWFGALFMGRLPVFAGDFLSGYLRWQTRLYGYVALLTDAYPPFSFADEPGYPIHVGIQPGRLNRLAVLFRIILVIPVSFIVVILAGAIYPVAFVAWLIVLVRGRMPRTLHQAIAAVVRYEARVTGYMTLLTAEYPWGLFGDFAAAGTVPLVLPGVGEGGAGMPHVTGAMPEAAPPADQSSMGVPAGVAPAEAEPGGWEPPGAAAPDAVPAGEGPPAAAPAPAAPPTEVTRWELILSAPARVLLGLFILLGLAVYTVAGIAGQGTFSGTVSRAEAINDVQAAHGSLDHDVRIFERTAASCQGSAQPLPCITAADGKVAAAFGSFGQKMRDTAMPSGSSGTAARRLADQATQVQRDLERLAASTSIGQYQQLLQTVALDQDLHRFDQDYHDLGKALGAV